MKPERVRAIHKRLLGLTATKGSLAELASELFEEVVYQQNIMKGLCRSMRTRRGESDAKT